MDNKFFANLAGIGGDDDELEPQLVATASKKKVDQPKEILDDEEMDVADEESLDLMDNNDEGGMDLDDVEGQLTIDVYQDDTNLYIESTVAGVDGDDLDIAITPESVSVKGKRKRTSKIQKDDYLYQECFWGSFSRSVILPQEIDPDKSKASIKNGVLKIVLPKINRSRSKKLQVKID